MLANSAVVQFNEVLQTVELPKLYHVPRTLSLASLLGGMLVFSVMFTIVRLSGGSSLTCMGIIVWVSTISIGQMMLTKIPRFASIVAGAACLPTIFLVATLFSAKRYSGVELVFYAYGYAILGLFFGYLSGGLLAGFWLVADQLEQLRVRRMQQVRST